MNDSRETERLLTEVLGEGAAADFRQSLLDETLRLARRHRRLRQVGRAVAALAVLAGLGLLVWQRLPSGSSVPPTKPYALVRTRPLPPAAWVMTKPLGPESLVASVATADVVTTAAAGVAIREMNDDELLTLAAPKAAVLVRLGPHMAELVFADPAAQEALMR